MSSIVDSVCPYKLFNSKFDDFIDDITPLLSNIKNFEYFVTTGKLFTKSDHRLNARLFYDCVYLPYGRGIMSRDDAFFMEETYDAITPEIKTNFPSFDYNVISCLKDKWKSLSDADRNAVWDHLHVLMVLNERCTGASLHEAFVGRK